MIIRWTQYNIQSVFLNISWLHRDAYDYGLQQFNKLSYLISYMYNKKYVTIIQSQNTNKNLTLIIEGEKLPCINAPPQHTCSYT